MASLVLDSRFGLVWLGLAGLCAVSSKFSESNKAVEHFSDATSQPPSQLSTQPANWLNIEAGMARLIPVSQIATKPAKSDDRSRRPQNVEISISS